MNAIEDRRSSERTREREREREREKGSERIVVKKTRSSLKDFLLSPHFFSFSSFLLFLRAFHNSHAICFAVE